MKAKQNYDRIKKIIDTIPAKILEEKTGVDERIPFLWKSGDRFPRKESQRKILRLEGMSNRIIKGSFEGYEKSGGKAIRVNRYDFNIKESSHYADLIAFGDMHKGHPQCIIDLAEETINYSLRYKVPMILMGDIMEFGQKTSPGDSVFTQKSIQKQIEYVEKTFEPLARAGLIVGYIDGNHEARLRKHTGVDISEMICKILKIPYLREACWNVLKVGKQFYSLYAIHGATGSQFSWTKLGYFVRLSHPFDCDVLVGAHVHDRANTVIRRQKLDSKKRQVIEVEKHVIITGGFLGYDQSYAQGKGYSIPEIGSTKIRFYADTHKITVHDVFQGKENRPSEWKDEEE